MSGTSAGAGDGGVSPLRVKPVLVFGCLCTPGGCRERRGGPAVASPGAGAQAGGMAASTELRFLGYVVIAREVRARSVSRNAAVGGLCCVAPEMSGLGKGLECRTSLSLEETRNPKSIKE